MPPPGERPSEALPGVAPLPPAPRPWIVYVDLDAYYVSCELRDQPELVGRPVIVGPPPRDGPSRGVVLSASYEARRFGVRSALPAAAAARMCPDAIWIPPDFSKYERIAHEVRSRLRRFSPSVVPYSIDEAAVFLEGESAEAARAVAVEIQRTLRDELGLPSSLGVARSRVIAKIATDRAKPGGILVVTPEEAAPFLAPLAVRSIPGVGPKTEALLREAGVATIGDLLVVPLETIEKKVGSFAEALRAIARGAPHEYPEGESGPRSRSTDHTYARDVDDWATLEATVRTLAGELAASLERGGLRYGSAGVAFRWSDFDRSQRSRAWQAAQEGAGPLEERAVRLARELFDAERAAEARAVRTVSVRAERLSERTQRQRSLDEFRAASAPGSR